MARGPWSLGKWPGLPQERPGMGGAVSRDPGEPALTQGLSVASSLAEGSLLGTPRAYLGPRGQAHHP